MSLDIVQGEKQPWSIKINTVDSNGNKTPLDLAGHVGITVCFKTGAGVLVLTKTATRVIVDSVFPAQISGNILIAESAVMEVVQDGITEVAVDFGGGDIRKSIILRSHVVTAAVCPTP